MKKLLSIVLLSAMTVMAGAQNSGKGCNCEKWYNGFVKEVSKMKSFSETGTVDSLTNVRKYLDKWSARKPDCAEWYTCNFNYHYLRSVMSSITTVTKLPPYAREPMVLQDSTGQTAGYMFEGKFVRDSLELREAISWLEQGLERYPSRLDIWQGEIIVYMEADDLDGMFAVFERLFAYASGSEVTWLYTLNEPVPHDPTYDGLEDTVQDKMLLLLDNGYMTEAMHLIDLALKYYPSSPVYLNSKGSIYYYMQDYANALVWMEKAGNANPDDELIRDNILYLKKQLEGQEAR